MNSKKQIAFQLACVFGLAASAAWADPGGWRGGNHGDDQDRGRWRSPRDEFQSEIVQDANQYQFQIRQSRSGDYNADRNVQNLIDAAQELSRCENSGGRGYGRERGNNCEYQENSVDSAFVAVSEDYARCFSGNYNLRPSFFQLAGAIDRLGDSKLDFNQRNRQAVISHGRIEGLFYSFYSPSRVDIKHQCIEFARQRGIRAVSRLKVNGQWIWDLRMASLRQACTVVAQQAREQDYRGGGGNGGGGYRRGIGQGGSDDSSSPSADEDKDDYDQQAPSHGGEQRFK